MFYECKALTVAPALPATVLAKECYSYMFYWCNLQFPVALPATTLAEKCYYSMFNHCSNIKLSSTRTGDYQTPYRIPVEGTGTTATNALTDMFKSTGGAWYGTPSINTTYYLLQPAFTDECLTFSSPTSFTLTSGDGTIAPRWPGLIEYSTDMTTWTEWDGTTITAGQVNNNYKIYVRGVNNDYIIRFNLYDYNDYHQVSFLRFRK